MTLNCTNPPDKASSDAGIAGTGILLSFMITAVLALILSTSVIFAELRGGGKHASTTIRRKLLNGYSDSQIMQGIGIQSVGLAKMGSLVPYHFFLIWMLSLLSMATHNATLLALVRDYRRDWVLRWLRQFLMFVNLALSCVSGIFILQAVSKGLSFSTLPIACVWQGGGGAADFGKPPTAADGVLSYVGTIAVIAGNIIIFVLATWYLHSRAQRWYKTIQVVGLLTMTAIAIGAAVRIILLSAAFGKPSIELVDGGDGERQWSFGQLLSMLLLVLPLVSAIEIYRGDVQMAPPVEDDERRRLFDGELQENPHSNNINGNGRFQPNPFFGSETNLFKRSADEAVCRGTKTYDL